MSNPRNDIERIDELLRGLGISIEDWNAASRYQEAKMKRDAARGYPLKDSTTDGRVARDGYGNKIDQPVERKDAFDE